MINTVKITKNGYLVNNSLSVPNSSSNRHFQEVQTWIAEGNTPEPEFTQEELDIKSVQEAKALKDKNRAAAMNGLTVTTSSGKEFDGDEISQSRMARAVVSSDPLETTNWVLADNSVALVTREELKEALKLAGLSQTVIWTT